MSGASTIFRKMAAALAALFVLLAGTPVLADACLQQPAVASEAVSSSLDASGAHQPCEDGCITCAQCQCHHATAAMPSAATADSKLIAFPSGTGADPPLALTTDPTFGLKRPPRG